MNYLPELIALVRHPAIQGRRGKWKVGDNFYSESYEGWCTVEIDRSLQQMFEVKDAIWIPKLSDPIQPERGLIGLLGNTLSRLIFCIGKTEGYCCDLSDCGAGGGAEMTILRPIGTRFKVTYPPSKSSTDWMAIEYECDDRP